MPPVSSPGSHERRVKPKRAAQDRASRIRFRRAMTLVLMTLALPGSAQLVAGNRRIGRIAVRISIGVFTTVVFCVLLSLAWHGFAFWVATHTFPLAVIRIVLILVAVGWAALFMDAWRLGQPLSLEQNQRLAIVGLNGLLCFSVAGVLLFGAHLINVQRDFIIAVFGDGTKSEATDGRYNVLLMGGDSGAGRWGLRPDSLTIASIDADTGRTVLFGLPRNMEDFPFKNGSPMAEQFPHGFDCDGCYLNGVMTWAADHTKVFKGSKNPGVDAEISAIEGITGLEINYWAMVNLQGFKDLVDAVGGVTLHVRDRIPVGGLGDDVTGYIEPGVHRLDGHDTLWFARAREGSDDYSRMARQKCVMSAMLEQISPKTMVTKFESIAKATSGMVETNLPASELQNFMDLAMKAKSQKIATVSFVPPMINSAEPDIALIKRKVAEAIDRAEGTAPPPGKGKRKHPATVTGGSYGDHDKGYAANQADDLHSAC